VTGKTLGTDLRKGKFTLPVLIFLRSASEFEREHCCQLVLDEKIEEMIELPQELRQQRRVKRINRSRQVI
jgi:geranylgeranyl pyrophosphate synthase